MLLNDLNDDCLLIIFKYVVDINDLLNLSQVCSRWSSLLSIKYTEKELLLCQSDCSEPNKVQHISRPVNFTCINVTRLLPNAKILDVNFRDYRRISLTKFPEISENNLSIMGIVCEKSSFDLNMLSCFPNLEMLVCSYLLQKGNYPLDLSQLKQLVIRNGSAKLLSKYSQSLNTNLLRLHLSTSQNFESYPGGNLSNLKILEYISDMDHHQSQSWEFDGFHLMDFCPSLESAYLFTSTRQCLFDTSIKNTNLRDLVIQQQVFVFNHSDPFPYYEILSKFPNLLHLAIRNSYDIDNDDVIRLVKMLPKIELLDFRGSSNITRRSVNLLNDYCSSSGRSIEIKYGESLKSDAVWGDCHLIREKIVYGFDFMNHCFNSPYNQIPILMVPK